jgi:exodeoxyribonuclease-3
MKSFARERGIGWRIDTFFATEKIKQEIKSIKIHDDVIGSDHCPVEIKFK